MGRGAAARRPAARSRRRSELLARPISETAGGVGLDEHAVAAPRRGLPPSSPPRPANKSTTRAPATARAGSESDRRRIDRLDVVPGEHLEPVVAEARDHVPDGRGRVLLRAGGVALGRVAALAHEVDDRALVVVAEAEGAQARAHRVELGLVVALLDAAEDAQHGRDAGQREIAAVRRAAREVPADVVRAPLQAPLHLGEEAGLARARRAAHRHQPRSAAAWPRRGSRRAPAAPRAVRRTSPTDRRRPCARGAARR